MNPIGNLLDRPKQYFNIDGLGEAGYGFMCLGFSLQMWLQLHTPSDAVWHQMYVFLPYMFSICAVIHYGTQALKKRFTYPRTGFVAYRKQDRIRTALLAGVGAALWAPAVAFAVRSHSDLALVTLFNLFITATYAYGIARMVRWKLAIAGLMTFASAAIVALPTSVLLAIAGEPPSSGASQARFMGAYVASIAAFGVLSFASGAISFYLYVRGSHAPAPEAQ